MSKTRNQMKYGINIRKYCSEHEAYLQERIDKPDDTEALLHYHVLKIQWLQHERLVHLVVTFIVSVLFLFTVYLFIILGSTLVLFLVVVVLVLLAAYIRHYFFLENKVQYWYTLYDTIRKHQR